MLVLGCHYATIPASAQTVVQTARQGAPEEPRDQLRILIFIAISGLFGGLVFTGATIALPKLLAERLRASRRRGCWPWRSRRAADPPPWRCR